jgi:membrane-bound lytic murein transglycosylase D
MSEAQKLAAKASEQTDFPIQANEQVLLELNRFAGTPDGRAFVKKSFDRMKTFEAMIEQKLKEYQLPLELKAVAVVESGVQNLPETKNPTQHGAGLWQFIPGAAQKYDLIDQNGKDYRLDPERETDAALRYLGAMYLQFNKNWLLALMAYNMGEDHVHRAKKSAKSNDAWQLVKAGYQNDKGYLAKVIAVTILMKNPEVLN